MHIIEKLMQKMKEKYSRVAFGLDPKREDIPDKYLEPFLRIEDKNFIKRSVRDSKGIIEGIGNSIFEYSKDMIDSLHDLVPVVKPKIAFFERYHLYDAYFKVCEYAKSKGLIVIADAKRSDIGTTSIGYSDAFLESKVFESPCDFLTVNPYFGSDSIKPFMDACNKNDKGIFVLVKTSNSSSCEIQDLITSENGKRVYEKVAELVASWGSIDENTGYSNVGAVVGATYPEHAAALRKAMPNTFFLVPGFGAQGGTVRDILGGFDQTGTGAIINVSRGISCAFKEGKYAEIGCDFKEAARLKAMDIIKDINNGVKQKFGTSW